MLYQEKSGNTGRRERGSWRQTERDTLERGEGECDREKEKRSKDMIYNRLPNLKLFEPIRFRARRQNVSFRCNSKFSNFFFVVSNPSVSIMVALQGDQIGRIVAYWAIVFFGLFSEKYWCFFLPGEKMCTIFGKKS
jgi:hypothetical protein